MYKLVIVGGPNQGASFPLQSGETTIGRQAGVTIVLASAKISKKHCTILVDSEGVSLKDEGSSNGTFVNGILVKAKKIKAGDKLSVGEYILELTEPQKAAIKKPVRKSNVLNFPKSNMNNTMGQGLTGLGVGALPGFNSVPEPKNKMPTDFAGKIGWFFEHSLMTVFYGINLKNEWRALCIGLFIVLTIGNLGISVYPLMEANRVTIVRETITRAKFLARQIADQNAPFLASNTETKTEIGLAESAEGVRVAVLTDLDSRIIAPGSKLNQYLSSGAEASFSLKARDQFRNGRETGVADEVETGTVVAIEPVKVLSPSLGKNVIVAMAIVSIDTTLNTPGMGEMGIVYFETLILTGLLGGLIFLIMYRVTLKPFSVLNEDMDRALKGDLAQVTHEYQFEELNSLWEIINSAIQRLPKAGESKSQIGIGGDAATSGSSEEFEGPLKMLGAISKFGVVVLNSEKKILYINSAFEEISGIRADGALGQEISDVARDQSLGPFVLDLFSRAAVGGEGASEDYDFSGIAFKVHGAAFGAQGQNAKCYLLAAVRIE